MKKIAFMFVAAALVAACGETKKPAEEVEAVVEEVVATAEDSAAAEALVADADSLVKDSIHNAEITPSCGWFKSKLLHCPPRPHHQIFP